VLAVCDVTHVGLQQGGGAAEGERDAMQVGAARCSGLRWPVPAGARLSVQCGACACRAGPNLNPSGAVD
jgi:hypothetical protein